MHPSPGQSHPRHGEDYACLHSSRYKANSLLTFTVTVNTRFTIIYRADVIPTTEQTSSERIELLFVTRFCDVIDILDEAHLVC